MRFDSRDFGGKEEERAVSIYMLGCTSRRSLAPNYQSTRRITSTSDMVVYRIEFRSRSSAAHEVYYPLFLNQDSRKLSGHIGVLHDFRWEELRVDAEEVTRAGAVIYISRRRLCTWPGNLMTSRPHHVSCACDCLSVTGEKRGKQAWQSNVHISRAETAPPIGLLYAQF
jgi:hypothetical protein